MRQNTLNFVLFLGLATALLGAAYYIEQTFFPPPPAMPPREAMQALTGTLVYPTPALANWRPQTVPALPPEPEKPATPAAPAPPPVPAAPAAPQSPPTLIPLGASDNFYQHVLLTTQGGAVQQVVLRDFDEANRLGREVKTAEGNPQPLRMIPGVKLPRDSSTLVEPNGGQFPDLAPGEVADPAILAEPSYRVLHYPSEDDPLRQSADTGRMNDKHPSPELGERIWTLTENAQTADGDRVTFETTLDAPYFLRLKKTFTLSPGDYHIGFQLSIEPLPGRQSRQGKFRYQIVGPQAMQVEGEWYAQSYRNVYVGSTSDGSAIRTMDDAQTIAAQHGGTAVPRASDIFTYAAVGTQYFASALCIDDTQPAEVRSNLWDYVRPTREPQPWDDPQQPFLSDVTFRVAALPIDLAPDAPAVTHNYLIYNGPMKVRLLKQHIGRPLLGQAPPEPVRTELVDRYLDNMTLRTLTDYHSPNVIGRFASSIGWSSVVIAFTNIMHSVLGFLHQYVPSWGVDIILLTVIVRLVLFLPSRRQQQSMVNMQAKQAAMKPELDKLTEKYKEDPSRLQQEKTKLMLAHGINPASALGGCLLLFAQMPIFMGLYFCLQESVFFRLQSFLWFPNLAAPDMTVWWSEAIPYLSTPRSIGSPLYLGPFWNVLPLLTVGLIFLQQYFTMPTPTDEMQAQQQKMMKFMIIIMAVFFYKVPAGLCVYFICSTSWALAERLLIKKPQPKLKPVATPGTSGRNGSPATPPAPATGFVARMKAKLEEAQRLADEQNKRQIRNQPLPGRGTNEPRRKKRK